MIFNTEKKYVLEFTEGEFKTSMSGIGNTNIGLLQVAGMTAAQANFFIGLYRGLYENIPK